MINGKKIVVVLPAYNAEKTLEATVRELPDLVDETILVDDYSRKTEPSPWPAGWASPFMCTTAIAATAAIRRRVTRRRWRAARTSSS